MMSSCNFLTVPSPSFYRRHSDCLPVSKKCKTCQKLVKSDSQESDEYVESGNNSRKHTARRVTDGGQPAGLLLHNIPRRRESFLYKSDSDMEVSTRSSTRNQSIAGDDTSIGLSEDIIITPFAQVLSSLKKVRTNFMTLTNLTEHTLSSGCHGNGESHSGVVVKIDEEESSPTSCEDTNDVLPNINTTTSFSDINEDRTRNISIQTLEELEWCLNQLETIQTSQSVSNLTSMKFKKMLSKELNLVSDKDGCNRQVSDYIFKTFLEEKDVGPVLDRNQLFQKSMERAKSVKYHHLNFDSFLKYPLSIQQRQIIEEFFEVQLNSWNMDVFLLHDISNGQSLTFTAYEVFKEHHFFSKFHIQTEKFLAMIQTLEFQYNSQVPYHNNTHAADVLHTTHVLLQTSTLKNVFSTHEIYAILLASIIHDIDHPGYTNQFLINTNDKLALLYNDISVLENHHLAVAFKIFQQHDNVAFSSFDKKEIQNMRRLIIDMVLATDMSKHMTLLADLKTLVETNKVSGSSIMSMDSYYERVQVLQIMIHCSDLSNPTKERRIYEKWVSRIMEEFFIQGDREKSLGIDISPMCDRNEADIAMSQVRFIDYIVHPLWETWTDLVYPESQFLLESLETNRDYYFSQTIDSKEPKTS